MVVARNGEVKFKYRKNKHWDFNLVAREYERVIAEQKKKEQI